MKKSFFALTFGLFALCLGFTTSCNKNKSESENQLVDLVGTWICETVESDIQHPTAEVAAAVKTELEKRYKSATCAFTSDSCTLTSGTDTETNPYTSTDNSVVIKDSATGDTIMTFTRSADSLIMEIDDTENNKEDGFTKFWMKVTFKKKS